MPKSIGGEKRGVSGGGGGGKWLKGGYIIILRWWDTTGGEKLGLASLPREAIASIRGNPKGKAARKDNAFYHSRGGEKRGETSDKGGRKKRREDTHCQTPGHIEKFPRKRR